MSKPRSNLLAGTRFEGLENSIESLGNTANRIADERNLFKAQRDHLLSAAKAALPHMRGANNPSSGLTAAREARELLSIAIAAAEQGA